MGVRQKNISGIFRRFLFSFLLAGAATILVLGVIVQILTIKAVIHPANYDEQQLEQKREEIQEAEKVEERMLPYGTRFGVFDNSGRWLYGTFTESEREEVWKAVLEEKNEIRSGYLKRFQREEEICLVSYQLRVQFGNPALRERFPHVLELLLLAALLIFCAEVMFLIRYFSRKIKQELQKIEWMTEKIEHQDLEFPCPDSQVLEIKKILETFGRMRDTLKESLMKQWELESARKEQMGALAHDLKTPLTVIRGNVQLMGEAESLEEAQKYSLALEQEIQGIEEYLQILQEMISTGGYQMYKKEQVDIRELTGQFRERIEAAAAGKKQTIQFECENLPKWICVNEKLLIRSWENLVYNAIEYTPQGGMIRICISEGKEQLEISVEDEGSGFSAEDLQSAKNLFYQGDKSRHSRKHYGMGLYLAEQFAKLPGIGMKSAQRLAYYVMSMTDEDASAFAAAITNAHKSVHLCSVCQNFTDKPKCPICDDPRRDHTTVCVVEDPKDIAAFERTKEYKGVYHVLHGLLSPMDDISPDKLKIKELLARIEPENVKEVIMATNPTVNGEATAIYISRLLKPLGVKVTRLAFGLPVGGVLEYADEVTLYKALENRNEI